MPNLRSDSPKVRAVLKEFRGYNTPRGTYFDAWPLHILTEASLRYLSSLLPDAQVNVRRFRPNILLSDDAGVSEPVEFDWVDTSFAIGSARLTVDWETVRCVMTTREQGDLPRASQIMRTLVRNTNQNLGIYADIDKEGDVKVGDELIFS